MKSWMKFSQVLLMSSTFSSLYSIQHNLYYIIYKWSTLVLYCRQPIYTINLLWIGCLYLDFGSRGCLTVKKIDNRTQPIPALGLWFCQPIMTTLGVYLHVISKLPSPCLLFVFDGIQYAHLSALRVRVFISSAGQINNILSLKILISNVIHWLHIICNAFWILSNYFEIVFGLNCLLHR